MNNRYKEFWEVPSVEEAWKKIILDSKENPIEALQTCELLLEEIPRGKYALEIGAGLGRLMHVMTKHFDNVWGIDLSESMVTFSKQYLKDYPNCQVKLGNGYRLPVANSIFDFVYSYITFQHMPDIQCVRANIDEIYRVLKPGGMCRVQTIKGNPYDGEWGTGGFGGYSFQDENDFCTEFTNRGFEASVKVTEYSDIPMVIWVTGKKPNG
jgi:ubiquinone/menaquinone biosynthesis C-methylase UbiE